MFGPKQRGCRSALCLPTTSSLISSFGGAVQAGGGPSLPGPPVPRPPCRLHQPPGALISAHLPQTDGGPVSGRGRVSCAVHLSRTLQTEARCMLVPEWSALQVATVTGGAQATLPDSSRSAQHSTMTHDFASPLVTPGSASSDFIQIFIYSNSDTFE